MSGTEPSHRWKQVCSSATAPTRSEASHSSAAGKSRSEKEKLSTQSCFGPRPSWKVAARDKSCRNTGGAFEKQLTRSLSKYQEIRALDELQVPSVAAAIQMFADKLKQLDQLDAELQMERQDTPTHLAVQNKLAVIRGMFRFLKYGGEVPPYFDVRPIVFSSTAFALQASDFVDDFLVTKSTAAVGSEPARRRAIYAITGICRGHVALRKLQNPGPIDQDIRKVVIEAPDAPGGYLADPMMVKRHLHVISSQTVKAWAAYVLTHEVGACHDAIQKAVTEEHTRNEREKEANLKLELYTARAEWRAARKQMSGQLLRELWAVLWNVNFPRVQTIAMALKRIGISMTDKVFHEVTVSGTGPDRYFIVLEDAGCVSEELPFEWHETVQSESLSLVRRYQQATALDAYDCMRGDYAAPPGAPKMRAWLLEQCGPPSRSQWASQFLTRSPGRNMMVSKSFVQRVLTDLINEALAVELPDAPGTVDDLKAWREAQEEKEEREFERVMASQLSKHHRSVADPRGTMKRWSRSTVKASVLSFLAPIPCS